MSVDHIPGPQGGRLLGSLGELRRDTLAALLDAQREHGDVVRFLAGPPGMRQELFGIFSPTGVQQVLASNQANFRKDDTFYDEMRAAIGDGLLTSQDETYLRQRRLIQPLFTRKHVALYADTMAAEAEAAAERWSGRDEIDAAVEMTTLTVKVVTRTLLGTDSGGAEDTIRQQFPRMTEYIMHRGFSPVNVPASWPTPANRRLKAARREFYEMTDALIASRSDAAPSDDLLSLLSHARTEDGDRLSQQEIRDQVLVFVLAGHETTAHTLAFALQLLGRHPEVQERLAAEVGEVLAGRTPTADDHPKLEYTTMVLKEAMRLYPASPLQARVAVDEATVDGHTIPAGANVYVSSYVSHRNARHWPDPERFDPERFTEQAEKDRPRYAWFPFSGGPRACIGQYFAMLEAVFAIAILTRRFRIESVKEKVGAVSSVTLRPVEPIICRLTPR